MEEMGMTNEQYKGMLIDQQMVWKDMIKLLMKEDDESARKVALEKAREQLEIIGEKLRF